MKTFLQPLQGLAEIEEIEKQAKKNHGILEVSGCIESQKAHLMYGLSGLFPSHLVIAADEKTAKDLYEDYRFYDKRVYYYPAKDLLFFQADIHGNLLIRQRMQVIRALLVGRRRLRSLPVLMAVWIICFRWKRLKSSSSISVMTAVLIWTN